jgi:hypothetical protein
MLPQRVRHCNPWWWTFRLCSAGKRNQQPRLPHTSPLTLPHSEHFSQRPLHLLRTCLRLSNRTRDGTQHIGPFFIISSLARHLPGSPRTQSACLRRPTAAATRNAPAAGPRCAEHVASTPSRSPQSPALMAPPTWTTVKGDSSTAHSHQPTAVAARQPQRLRPAVKGDEAMESLCTRYTAALQILSV